MKRYYLLNPGDFHMDGDEIYNPSEFDWFPLDHIHKGERMAADSHPCRRELTRHQLLKLSVEANLERVTAMV